MIDRSGGVPAGERELCGHSQDRIDCEPAHGLDRADSTRREHRRALPNPPLGALGAARFPNLPPSDNRSRG